jgi:hypothetical protein
MNKITRKYLVNKLRELLTDEYDPSELVYCTDEDLVKKIIEVAEYYQREFNDSHK